NSSGGIIRAINSAAGGVRFVTGYLVNQGLIDGGNSDLQITSGTYEAAGGTIQGPVAVVNSQVRVTASPPGAISTTIVLQGSTTLLGNNLPRTILNVQATGSNSQLTVPADASNAGTIVLDNIY